MRTSCRACNGSDLQRVLDLGQLPLAGGFLVDQNAFATEKFYTLAIHSCKTCGLVQMLNSVEPDILFQNYSFSSSTVKPLVEHFTAYATWIVKNFKPKTVVEFGCNDGVLLLPLEKLGIKAIGVDISSNITALARNKGLDVITGHFDLEVARNIYERVGKVDVVTGSNTFAHNDQPEKILEAANLLLSDDGYLCLEFMYAGDLLEQLQWDTLYHEHLTFYTLSALQILLKKYDFYVVAVERLPMHGGSLRVCAGRKQKTVFPSVDALLQYEKEKELTKLTTWLEFAQNSLHRIAIVHDVFGALQQHYNIWAYGAAGKATMWVNACQMHYLGGVVEESPLRAGKFMPGTHTPVVFPEQFKKTIPDYVLITAWNYAKLIRSKEHWFKGTWAVPLPDLRFF